ncbi:MAG: hypothetical protein O2780_15195 [Proteobacteria bacterium]|nr:hypothetical protein [Pseudomonadota bacterium]MDA1300365.1 hypothetical protein [Pseudomonadota bacterium]
MRELTSSEISSVSGGFAGTPIPFTNKFIPGPNWPGGWPSAVTLAPVAWGLGQIIGGKIYNSITEKYGMTVGEAAYMTIHGTD